MGIRAQAAGIRPERNGNGQQAQRRETHIEGRNGMPDGIERERQHDAIYKKFLMQGRSIGPLPRFFPFRETFRPAPPAAEHRAPHFGQPDNAPPKGRNSRPTRPNSPGICLKVVSTDNFAQP